MQQTDSTKAAGPYGRKRYGEAIDIRLKLHQALLPEKVNNPSIYYCRFQDGASTANNPSGLALQEALRLWPNTPIDCLVSLGSGVSILQCPCKCSTVGVMLSGAINHMSNTWQHLLAQHDTAWHGTAPPTAQHGTAQYSTAQRSAALHGMAQHSTPTAQHSTAQYSTAQRSAELHGMGWHSTAHPQHSTAQRCTAWHSTAQHSTAQHCTAQHCSAQLQQGGICVFPPTRQMSTTHAAARIHYQEPVTNFDHPCSSTHTLPRTSNKHPTLMHRDAHSAKS